MIEDVLDKLDNVRTTSKGYSAKCPAHNDKSPSLSIRQASDRVLLHCHAGCDIVDICAALGIEVRDLFSKVAPVKRAEIETRKVKENNFERVRQEAFMELIEYRDLIEEIYRVEGLEVEGDALEAVHQLPLIEHYLHILAVGTKREVLELFGEGACKWETIQMSTTA